MIAALAEALIYEVLPLLGEYEAESEVETAALEELRSAVGVQDSLTPAELVKAVESSIRLLATQGA